MNNKFRISALAAILIFAATTLTQAQQRRGARAMQFPEYCQNVPDLTDAQKEQITEINEAHRKTVDGMREQFRNAEDIFTSNEIKAKMTLEQNVHLKNISKILTEEQQKVFMENHNNRTARGAREFARGARGARGAAFGRANARGQRDISPGMQRGGRGTGGRGGYGRW